MRNSRKHNPSGCRTTHLADELPGLQNTGAIAEFLGDEHCQGQTGFWIRSYDVATAIKSYLELSNKSIDSRVSTSVRAFAEQRVWNGQYILP